MPDDGKPEASDGGGAKHGGSLIGRLLIAEEVAELLGVTPAWVYEQSRAGRIPTVTLGRYRRYRREAISAWIEELERHGVARARRAGAKLTGEAA
jgi:excisionase family DNA binding protein